MYARQVREGQVGLLAEWRPEDEGERYVSVSLSQSDMQRTLLFMRAAKHLTAKKTTTCNLLKHLMHLISEQDTVVEGREEAC